MTAPFEPCPILPQTTSVPMNRVCGNGGDEVLPVDHHTGNPTGQCQPMQAVDAASQQIVPSSSGPASGQSQMGKECHVNEQNTEALYRSWKLRWKWTTIIVLVETGFIVTIIVLAVISKTHDGIATVAPPATLSFPLSHIKTVFSWAYELLWTTLPTFIMNIFGVMWTTTVDATAARQPYVDLRNTQSTKSAKNTICLDYGSEPSLYRWIIAFRNKHGLVGAALLLNLITSLILVPLTSHLFATSVSTSLSRILVFPTSMFNESALTGRTSLRPAIDLTNAIHTYNSTLPAWMTAEYAFLPFSITDKSYQGNLTLDNATAYSAYLDCVAPLSYSAELSNNDGLLTLSATDRGCSISTSFGIGNSTPIYSYSWDVPSCSNSTYGRIGIITGYYNETSPIKLSSPSFISCIAYYYQSSGSLTQAITPTSLPTFINFDLSEQKEIRPAAYITLEDTLHDYNTFDPTSATAVDAFGWAVLSAARRQTSGNLFDTNLIRNTTESLYATLFAALCIDILFQPIDRPVSSTQATVSLGILRLYVYLPFAWAIVGILVLMLAFTLALFLYAHNRKDILTEELSGLLGAAVVLDQSEVGEFVRRVKEQNLDEKKVEEFIQGWYRLDIITCWFDSQTSRIRMGLAEWPSRGRVGRMDKFLNAFKMGIHRKVAENETTGAVAKESGGENQQTEGERPTGNNRPNH